MSTEAPQRDSSLHKGRTGFKMCGIGTPKGRVRGKTFQVEQ